MMPGEVVSEHLDFSALPQPKQHALLAKSFAIVAVAYVVQLLLSPVFWDDVGNVVGGALISLGTMMVG